MLLISAALVTSYADSARVRNSVEPVHTIKFVSEDGTKVTYWGLGYKVIRYPSVSPKEPCKNNCGVKYGSWFMKYEVPVITHQTAIEIAKKTFDHKSTEAIINFNNPKIEEVIFETNPSIYLFEGINEIIGKELYKIPFNTTQDGLLGPIVLYIDKLKGDLIGADYRE